MSANPRDGNLLTAFVLSILLNLAVWTLGGVALLKQPDPSISRIDRTIVITRVTIPGVGDAPQSEISRRVEVPLSSSPKSTEQEGERPLSPPTPPVPTLPIPQIPQRKEQKKTLKEPKPIFSKTSATKSQETQDTSGSSVPGPISQNSEVAHTLESSQSVSAGDSDSESYDIPAEALSQVQPNIPSNLKEQEFTSSLRIRVIVDKNGRGEPSLRTSSGNPEIDLLVLQAIKKWTWKPASRNGESVASTLYFKFLIQVD